MKIESIEAFGKKQRRALGLSAKITCHPIVNRAGTIFAAITLFISMQCYSQSMGNLQDSTLNNLVHPAGYKTCRLGELGSVKKSGTGDQAMILIPGLGFGGEVFKSFIDHYEKNYTVYAITPAGFAGTPAPPMPGPSTTYSELTWTNGIVTGVLNLIERENL